MAEGKIKKQNAIDQFIGRFAIKDGPNPPSENSYPRVELRGVGAEDYKGFGIVYSQDASTYEIRNIVDPNGRYGIGAIITQRVEVTLPAKSNHVLVTAPSIAGFEFLCWLGASSQGAVKNAYIDDMLWPQAGIWVETTQNTDTRYAAFALYRRGLNTTF